jgi:hypothetical protein
VPTRFLKFAVIFFVVSFLWGTVSARYQKFPWSIIHPVEQEIREFIQGDTSENTKITEKIANDLSLRPSRQLFDYATDNSRLYKEITIPGLKERRALPILFSPGNDRRQDGYRFIFGSFDFTTHLHGGILLDRNNTVVNTWVVDEEAIKQVIQSATDRDGIERKYKPAARRLPQGVEVLPDGSIIFNDGDRGNGMHRLDRCGRYTWSTTGYFHHSIDLNPDDGTLWTFGPGDMMQLDPETGSILRSISLGDVQFANSGLSLFGVRRNLDSGVWDYDPIHKNDIEPLSRTDASGFTGFEPGDLLVSHRATNLIFVFDPDTLKVKWWRAGQTRRQHDPDWQGDGSITVFDNNLRENYGENWDGFLPDGSNTRYSRIWKFYPDRLSAEIIYDGIQDNMYSGERSKHQMLPNGNILITSAHQGRVLEVSPEGDTVFEFLNRYDEKQNLILSEAKWLPPDFFNIDFSDSSACHAE